MSNDSKISRRKILQSSAVMGLATAGSLLASRAPAGEISQSSSSVSRGTGSGKAKNVILMVSDGMSMGVPTLASPFAELIRGEGTIWPQLLKNRDAEHGLLETRSANSLVTDSAAAASAWGCGHLVNNGSLNILPDKTEKTPLGVLLKDRQKRIGLVTTDKITGATPSGFAVNQKSRHDYMEIAPQFMDRADVILGGGRQYFGGQSRPDNRDLIAEYKAKGYEYCSHRRELSKLEDVDRVLGLFADDTLSYTIDRRADITLQQTTPTLPEMTSAAIDHLSDKDNGFFLMVEGGRVDHAAHANDAAALLYEQIEFEDAIGTVLDFIRQRDDTLLIITSDHGNANPGLNGFGPGYSRTNESFARLSNINGSFGTIRERLRDAATKMDLVEAAEEVLHETCGIQVTEETAEIVGEALVLKKLPDELAILQRSWVGVLSQVLGNHTGIGFTGTNHTADHTLLTSIGPGASKLGGSHPHTDIFHHIMSVLG